MVSEPGDSPRRWCFGCGDDNPQGLHIQFSIEEGAAVGRFATEHAHQGYPGVAHGGVAAAALDEAMGWAMYAAGAWAMTARMEVRFRRPVPLGDTLIVRARVTRDRGRWLEARGDIRSEGGQVLAEARALFMRLPADRARQMQEFYVSGAGERAGG